MSFKLKYVLIVFFYTFLCFANIDLPTAGDINTVIIKADEITNSFLIDSFELRTHYEFSGKIIKDNDKLAILKLSRNTSTELREQITKQQKYLELIENYEGDDWEQRYGKTELWRKLDHNCLKTKADLCLIESYQALTSKTPQRDGLIKKVISRTKEIDRVFISKAKALALIAQLKPEYKDKALKELERFKKFSDVYGPTSAEIEKIRLLNKADPNEIKILIKRIEQNNINKYKELLIQLVILQREYDFYSYIETLNEYPQIKSFICQLISHSVLNDPDFGIEPAEAEMLAEFALLTDPQKYQNVLVKLSQNEKLDSALIDYSTAISILDTDPHQSVELMVKASKSHNKNPNSYIKVDAVEIAKQAAIIGYDLYLADHTHVETPAAAFYNYSKLAGDDIDEDIQWQYVLMHINNFDAATGYDMLKDIRKRKGKYSKKVTLYLASEQVRKEAYKDLNQRRILLQQFADSLEGKYDCYFYKEAYGLVEDTLLQIELFEEDKNIITGSIKIAEFLTKCNDQKQTSMNLAELLLIADDTNVKKAEKLIQQFEEENQSLRLTRINARFNQNTGEYNKAAEIWGQIVNSLNIDDDTLAWRWWRAKYYQLYCAYNAGENPENILHTIDVLRSIYSPIPAFWAAKLGELKQTIDK